jgi:hypothetical protein
MYLCVVQVVNSDMKRFTPQSYRSNSNNINGGSRAVSSSSSGSSKSNNSVNGVAGGNEVVIGSRGMDRLATGIQQRQLARAQCTFLLAQVLIILPFHAVNQSISQSEALMVH